MDFKGERVQIFTDGACKGNPGVGGWGVLIKSGEHEKELNGYDFSFIDLNSILDIKKISGISIVSPKNKSITSSENLFYVANVLSNRSPQLSYFFNKIIIF